MCFNTVPVYRNMWYKKSKYRVDGILNVGLGIIVIKLHA